MRIDLKTAEACSRDLKAVKNKMESILEQTARIHTELAAEENEGLEELVAQLYAKIRELDDETVRIKALVTALDGIISVYEKTEKKVCAHLNRIGHSRKGTVVPIELEGVVPAGVSDLFK
ncbi:MAG: hypothetical protein IJC50_09300 [Clostridia bacterium]|nr:hypothetical protein [Clostridia bacterium]